jgi:predicted AlkP superfamily pyrophosphatase or phosphodiesterase
MALAALMGLPAAVRADPPRLVVIVVIDQLRRDRLDPDLPGGLGKLVREGRVYREGVLDHAITATCPGHVSIATGRHPGPAGAPGNSHVNRASAAQTYCVQADPQTAGVFGTSEGRSPDLLRVTALGDWLKERHPGAKVVSVSGKDRSAISLGGKRADDVIWFSRKVGFTTSQYYEPSLPEWLAAFNTTLVERVPEQWIHDPATAAQVTRADDYEGESNDRSGTSPHPLRADEFEDFTANLYFSPFLDEITIDLARELIQRRALGADAVPDVLSIGLSATDTVGHLYGPGSHESRDALRRLDAKLGELLTELEASVGREHLLVALSADHGVLPLPEALSQAGENRCPVEGSRIGIRSLALGLTWELHKQFTGLALPDEWIVLGGAGLTVNRPLAKEKGVAVEAVAVAAAAYLEEQPGIRRAWLEAEVLEGTDEFARLYRNSFDPERSGDILVQLEPTCLIAPFDQGTSHGTPYLYDRAVPILFYGGGIEPGAVSGPARTIDIAPTLARRLEIAPPTDLDGTPLF